MCTRRSRSACAWRADIASCRIALCRADQFIAQHELRPGDRIERQQHLAGLGQEPRAQWCAAEQPAAETLAAIERPRQLYLCVEPGEALVILGTDQRTVDSR